MGDADDGGGKKRQGRGKKEKEVMLAV